MKATRIMAVFVPESWVNDHAIEIDGRVEFDVTDRILALRAEERDAIRDNRDTSDRLVPSEIAECHHGPFRVEVRDAIDAYFEEIEASESNRGSR